MRKLVPFGIVALFASAAPAFACTPIASAIVALSACVAEEWQPVEGGVGAQEFLYNTPDGSFGLTIITEKEASDIATFRDAIVQNAVNASGDASLVTVIGERTEIIDGNVWNVLEYELQNQGRPLIFQNFYYTQPGFGSVQILGYSLANMATSAAWKAGLFASTIKMGS